MLYLIATLLTNQLSTPCLYIIPSRTFCIVNQHVCPTTTLIINN